MAQPGKLPKAELPRSGPGFTQLLWRAAPHTGYPCPEHLPGPHTGVLYWVL